MSKDGEERISELASILGRGGAHIHMSGVLGVSMSSIARMLAERGIKVSGSDDNPESSRAELEAAGIMFYNNVCEENVVGIDALVYSSAIPPSHPDRQLAARKGVPEYCRAELLGTLMSGYKSRIGVSGTHGKSTTTSMLSAVFSSAGLCPTVLCGAQMNEGGAYVRGGSEYLIYEACEYRDSFLHFSPNCAIITNIELDHTDYFKSSEDLCRSFLSSAAGAERAVVGVDSPLSSLVAEALGKRAATVGRSCEAEYRYSTLGRYTHGSRFEIARGAELIGEFFIGAPGEHNVANAAIAALTALHYGISVDIISSALSDFSGLGKRLERLGDLGGCVIYRDYAHHPTEIRAALETLRDIHGSVTVLFRPHTYTRTRDLWDGFVRELSTADEVCIYEIYPARESPITGVSSSALAAAVGGTAVCSEDAAVRFITSASSSAVVLMGAGDLGATERKISGLIKGDTA